MWASEPEDRNHISQPVASPIVLPSSRRRCLMVANIRSFLAPRSACRRERMAADDPIHCVIIAYIDELHASHANGQPYEISCYCASHFSRIVCASSSNFRSTCKTDRSRSTRGSVLERLAAFDPYPIGRSPRGTSSNGDAVSRSHHCLEESLSRLAYHHCLYLEKCRRIAPMQGR